MEQAGDGGLRFITGNTPAELRSKKNMTIIRKKAMDHFLKDDKKGNGKSSISADRSRLNSENSDMSRSSIGSQEAVNEIQVVPRSTSQQSFTRRKQQTSTISPTNNGSSPESQVARFQKAIGSVLSPAPIVPPMREQVTLPYDVHVPPPLSSIGKSLDPFRTMFQASHPHINVEKLKWYCSRYFGTRGLGKYWIPICLDHAHTFLSTLCLASVHHDIVQELEVDSLRTVALRQEIIHLVGKNLLNHDQSIADHNIVALTQLIIGDVIGRQESGLAWHEAGIDTMIKQRGGLNQLGMEGRLASAISWVTLASAILREAKPRTMYADYCTAKSTKNYPPTATIPESPIYCPRGKFITVQRSAMCKQHTLELLGDIRMMIDIFLHETKQSRRNSQTLLNLHRKISNDYLPISEFHGINILTPDDWKYEAIRITAKIQATAIMGRIPLSDALTPVAAPRQLASLYTSSIGSRSSDSLVSPFDVRNDTPITEYSTSPSYSTYSTSPAMHQTGFPFNTQRPSLSSTHRSFDAPRPSFSSTRSTSSNSHVILRRTQAPSSAPTALLRSVKNALENSNLSECWSDMAGVLLWIGLVIGAASRTSEDKILRRYFSATAMRAGIMLCFEHPEAIHSTMLRMGEVIEALSNDNKGEIVRKESEAPGKRRKV
ncbi:Nn.00g018330.m01.CDS01 [Neocucurbitaria sp. VM-36]